MTDVGLPEFTKEGRKEVGEGWIFLIYTLLVMMRISFHKVVLVKVYGVEYGMFVVFPGFAGGSPLIRTAIIKQVARCYQKLYSPTWSEKQCIEKSVMRAKGFNLRKAFPV